MTEKNLTAALAAPFELREVKFKPQSVKNNRALALAYVDARVIEDRLDTVLGVENWQDDYEMLPDGAVVCRLRVKIGEQWITKMDVGSPSEQPDSGDRVKAAFSDALKRAAVKFGIGRYLYRLPAVWADYDSIKKQFTSPPQLPAFALPPKPTQKPAEVVAKPTKSLPATGQELHDRIHEFDRKLATQKLCSIGDLLSFVAQSGESAGYGPDLSVWAGPAIAFAVEKVREFESSLRSRAAGSVPQKSVA